MRYMLIIFNLKSYANEKATPSKCLLKSKW